LSHSATVLENFHEWDEEAEDAMEEEEGEAWATNVVARLVPPVVVATLRMDILPLLETLTVVEDNEGKGGTVRPAASAAVISLLRLLPARDLDSDIGRVLGKIANCLRSRAQGGTVHELNPVETHSLKPPGFTTLESMK
jgi:hypothetical protein